MKPSLILVNPWIYDFAAYDLWSKPFGLLLLAGFLREYGFRIHLIDCLDVYHSSMTGHLSEPQPVRRLFGTGKFRRQKTSRPASLKHVPRPYSRYGIAKDVFLNELASIKDPAAILVTSLMTYWYPGVQKVISLAKEVHPGVPIILGGIYARLCKEHALQFSGADHVAAESGLNAMTSALPALRKFGIERPERAQDDDILPYPAFDLLSKIEYVCLLTSTGCPYKCRYCASPFLSPRFMRRDPALVLEEILHWHRSYGVRDFAFYDDALLVGSDDHIVILLENLVDMDLNLRFHTPNALHVREITPEVARLLRLSGFRTIRLGLETSDMDLHQNLDKKVSAGEFEKAIDNLKRAGFTGGELGAYILAGLPGQSVASVINTMEFVDRTGAVPYLAEYSPIPHTPMWKKAIDHSEYDLSSDPIYHNNTLFPCWDQAQRERVPDLKKRVREIRHNRH